MTYEHQYITAHLNRSLSGADIESFIDRLFRRGFTTTEADSRRDNRSADFDTGSEAIERVSKGKSKSLTLWYSNKAIEDPVEVDLRFLTGEPTPFVVSVAVSAYHLNSSKDRNTLEQVTQRSYALVRFGQYLTELLDPLHVESRRSFDAIDIRNQTPFPPLRVDSIDVGCPLDWYGIFRPGVVECIGTAWLEDTDVYRRERLDDGSLLVMVTERPDDKQLDERLNTLASAILDPKIWTNP